MDYEEQLSAAKFRAERDIARQELDRLRDRLRDTTMSAYDLLPEEEREAIAWVREHGGLDAVRERWAGRIPRAYVENMAERQRERRERMQRHIEYIQRLCRERRERIGELNREIADMRPRLMPEDMEWLLEVWPRWSNGEYCRFGDWWTADRYGDYEPRQLRRLVIYAPELLDEWEQGDGKSYGYEWDFMRPSELDYRPDKVEPPAPAVIAADGEPLEAGQTVWFVEDGDSCDVAEISRDGRVLIEYFDGSGSWHDASEFTHQRPVLDADGNRIEPAMDVWWICEGDERGIHAEKLHVESIGDDGFVTCDPFNGGTWVELEPSELYVNKPVLDADGVPIHEGDTVYGAVFGGPFTVTEVSDKGSVFVDAFPDTGMHGSMFTHAKPEPPDSWEQLKADIYREIEMQPTLRTTKCGIESFVCDIVRRCKSLAERGE